MIGAMIAYMEWRVKEQNKRNGKKQVNPLL
jgi:hypothetical protein